MSQRLSDVIEDFIGVMHSQGAARNTIRAARQTYDHLLAQVGNVQIKHLSDQHFDDFFAARMAKGDKPNTLNSRRTFLRNLVAYARRRKYISGDPVGHIKAFKVIDARKLRIPASDFGRVLDAASHPQDRIVVAMGLYLFVRSGEVRFPQIHHLNLARGEIEVWVEKVKKWDTMPICTELDTELRRWLTWYTEDQGRAILEDPECRDWFLVPTKARSTFKVLEPGKKAVPVMPETHLNPRRPISHPYHAVQRTLFNAGYQLRDSAGESLREGGHTLRRSGARALFDHLANQTGYDGAGRTVQSMLHHASFSTTETYLGLDLDYKRRDDLLRSKPMFGGVPAGNVIALTKEA